MNASVRRKFKLQELEGFSHELGSALVKQVAGQHRSLSVCTGIGVVISLR